MDNVFLWGKKAKYIRLLSCIDVDHHGEPIVCFDNQTYHRVYIIIVEGRFKRQHLVSRRRRCVLHWHNILPAVIAPEGFAFRRLLDIRAHGITRVCFVWRGRAGAVVGFGWRGEVVREGTGQGLHWVIYGKTHMVRLWDRLGLN